MGQSDVWGTVTITASEANSAFASKFIENSRPSTRIKIEIVAKNDSADLRKREADIAVRNFQPKQPD